MSTFCNVTVYIQYRQLSFADRLLCMKVIEPTLITKLIFLPVVTLELSFDVI